MHGRSQPGPSEKVGGAAKFLGRQRDGGKTKWRMLPTTHRTQNDGLTP